MKANEFHGSDIEAVSAYYNIPIESIICFSDNVNPLGISPMLEKAISENIHSIEKYPDRNYTKLKESVAKYCNTDINRVFVGSGATDIITRTVKGLNPKKAVVIEPTYSQYVKSLKRVGAEVISYVLRKEDGFVPNLELLEKAMGDNCDVMVLCNPNNPTGVALKGNSLKELLNLCKSHNTFLMIDETYVEFAENIDEISGICLASKYDNFCVMRGVSKFFAAPGLRFGYGITGDMELIKEIEGGEDPWGIHSIAAETIPYMFSDVDYIHKTRRFISDEKKRLIENFYKMSGIDCIKSDTNFVLTEIVNEHISSKDVFEALISKGIMIRDCSSFKGLGNKYYRFCIKTEIENNLFIENLSKILG